MLCYCPCLSFSIERLRKECVAVESDWGLAAQVATDFEIEQHVNWCLSEAAIWTASGRGSSRHHPKPASGKAYRHCSTMTNEAAHVKGDVQPIN